MGEVVSAGLACVAPGTVIGKSDALGSYSITMLYMMTAADARPAPINKVSHFFAEPLRDYVLQGLGRRSACSRRAAWRRCASSASASWPRAASRSRSPPSTPTTRSPGGCCGRRSRLRRCDHRRPAHRPIPQRAYDVVYCALLLERVHHVELVLDRLVSALKPGGLLLLRTGDRYSAAALLDRLLPGPVRGRLVPVPPRHPRARSGRSTRRRSARRASPPTRCCAASSSPPAPPS